MRLIKKCFVYFLYNPVLLFQKLIARICVLLPWIPSKISIPGIYFQPTITTLPRSMEWGMYEPTTKSVFKRILKSGDSVIDVGANVGYFSAVALSIVGHQGQVHSFEPVPEYFSELKLLQSRNPKSPLFIHQVALGDEECKKNMAVGSAENIGWNTLVTELMQKDHLRSLIEVPVIRLDRYLLENKLQPKLIKIDAEGYEFPILRGLGHFFEKTDCRPAIYCEASDVVAQTLHYSLHDLVDFMKLFGYQACCPVSFKKLENLKNLIQDEHVLFLPHR